MPSCNESFALLPSDLRNQLNSLVEAYERGIGPVEQEVQRRNAAALPTSPVQIQAYAEECYPSRIRELLDGLGYSRLYQDDLDRALAATPAPTGGPGGADSVAISSARRSGNLGDVIWLWARVLVFVFATLAGAAIVMLVMPKLEDDQHPSNASRAVVQEPMAAPAPQENRCLQALRNNAVAWCQRALTGSPMDGPPETQSDTCGDTLEANSETVRSALNGILDDDAAYTYTPDQARARCAAAANLAVTPEGPAAGTR